MNLNKELIKQLSEGKIALRYNKSDINLLQSIIKKAFPKDSSVPHGTSLYYCGSSQQWFSYDRINQLKDVKIVPISEFLIKEEEQKFLVSREALKEVYDIVCVNWQTIIEMLLRSQLFEQQIEIKSSLLIDAHNAATTEEQKKWLEKHLPKPKKKVKKEVIGFVNVYKGSFAFHKKEEAARKSARSSAIAIAVPMKGEYEIEE